MFVAAIELPDEIEPLTFAARNLVEVLFHLRRERDVDEIAEMRPQQPRHGKGRKARYQRLALPEDVAAPFDGADRRRVGRRPADAESFELLDERGFGVARRRRRFVPLGVQSRPDADADAASAVTHLADRAASAARVSCSPSSATGSSLPST